MIEVENRFDSRGGGTPDRSGEDAQGADLLKTLQPDQPYRRDAEGCNGETSFVRRWAGSQ